MDGQARCRYDLYRPLATRYAQSRLEDVSRRAKGKHDLLFFFFSFCRILTGGVGAACLYMYIL